MNRKPQIGNRMVTWSMMSRTRWRYIYCMMN